MTFIINNNNKGFIFDIRDSRKFRDLEIYFKRYSRAERQKVKLISIAFYSSYIFLAEKLLKNADTVIDGFHIIVQAHNTLNYNRISLYYKSNPNYKKLINT